MTLDADVDILNDRELDALHDSPDDDVDMASVRCVVRELRARRVREPRAEDRTALAELLDDIEWSHAEHHATAFVAIRRILGDTPKWKVTSFDRDRLIGVVDNGEQMLRFHSTSFQSDTSFRWPRVGEEVEVAFSSSGALLSVHGT